VTILEFLYKNSEFIYRNSGKFIVGTLVLYCSFAGMHIFRPCKLAKYYQSLLKPQWMRINPYRKMVYSPNYDRALRNGGWVLLIPIIFLLGLLLFVFVAQFVNRNF
jgi:hypothetical protein